MAVLQRKPTSSTKVSSGASRDAGADTFSHRTGDPDEALVLSTLKNLVAAGEHCLDPILAAIADAALSLTGASGVALAMRKEGAMVCRARSGETAPVLGARVSADTGISGECLRTGKTQHCPDTENNPLVDLEVCRTLGLRSIAVLPIHGKRGVSGILETFSTAPAAFTQHHLGVLGQLAALAEQARASEPPGASPAPVVKLPIEEPRPQAVASDRVGDFARAGRRSGAVVLGALVLAGIVLLGFAVWRGWLGRAGDGIKARAPAPSAATSVARAYSGGSDLANPHPLDRPAPNGAVEKPSPGGRSLSPSSGKTPAGKPVKLPSKVDASEEKKKTKADRSLLVTDAATIALPQRAPEASTGASVNSSEVSHAEEAVQVAPPQIAADQRSTALNGVLSAKAVLPELFRPVSEGVSGGQLLHRVPPVYPAQAKILHLEGKVILDAMVMEDGTLRDLKVVQGDPALAQSAVEAVKQWRYQPFTLDGKPVKTETRITVEFKLP